MDKDVIIYARLTTNECAPSSPPSDRIIAMFGSTSLENIIEQSGMPQEAVETIPASIVEQPGFYYIPFPAEETDISIHPARKIHVGDFSTIHKCITAIGLQMNLYALQIGETLRSVQPARPAAPRYADIHADHMLTHIVTTYVTPLVRAINTGGDTNRIREAFAAFGTDTPVLRDIIGLCDALQSQPRNTTLSDAYLLKIVAIKREDYEGAKHCNDVIHGRATREQF